MTTGFKSWSSAIALTLCLNLLACQTSGNSQISALKPQSPVPSPVQSPSPAKTSAPAPLASAPVPSPTPVGLTPSQPVPSSPVSTPTPAISSSPVPVTPQSESPFDPLETSDSQDLNDLFGQVDETGSPASIEQEQAVYHDLFQSEQSELKDFVSFELTTDGGALLFGEDLDFSTQAFSLVTAPKAWVRKGLTQVKQRVHLRVVDENHLVLRLVRDLKGDFLIERDGTLLRPNPGSKAIQDRLIKRIGLVRNNGRWQINQTSASVIIPKKPLLATLPKIQTVRVLDTNNLKTLYSLKNPLELTSKDQLPVMPESKKLLLEVKLKEQESDLKPANFVYAHAFQRRLRLNDAGLQGDLEAGDGIYSRELETPGSIAKGHHHLAIDVLPASTMADENTDNYQSMIWIIPFRGSANP